MSEHDERTPRISRRIPLCFATFAVAFLAGCALEPRPLPITADTAEHRSVERNPTASPAPGSTTSSPADPCSWLTKDEAQTLLDPTVNTVFDGLGSPLGSMTDGPLECSYSPGSLEGATSPTPGSGETGASVSILDSTYLRRLRNQHNRVVSDTVNWVPASTIFPGASSDVHTFYAIRVTRPIWDMPPGRT